MATVMQTVPPILFDKSIRKIFTNAIIIDCSRKSTLYNVL